MNEKYRPADEITKVSVEGGDVVTYSFGGGDDVILVLHGTPVPGTLFHKPHTFLVDQGFRVVHYDQLGTGKSDKPDDSSLWTIQRYAQEVETVRQELGLGKVQIIGVSWGGMLALEYMLTFPEGVKSLVLESAFADAAFHQQESDRLLSAFGPEFVRMRRVHEIMGTTDSQEYKAADWLMFCRHGCRMTPWPPELMAAMETLDEVSKRPYQTIVGEEFCLLGNLKTWNRLPDLHRITQPTLITVGEYDHITPEEALKMRLELPNSRAHVFRGVSHAYIWEATEEYRAVLGKFLTENK